jgi:polyferredoxin
MTNVQSLYQPQTALDVLKVPFLGKLLRWRYGRLVFQIPLFVIAVLLIYDGFTGPELAAQNLATVVPWVHYRGLVVLALLVAGNLFCMGCPFTLTRGLAKRLNRTQRRFPRVLRNKWLSIVGLFGLFFLYEWLNLWSSPALTAWVIVAYFVASFTLELVFAESAFCKYVCPLGAFNFVYSTVAPTQITAKNTNICQTCVGKECVNGSYNATPLILIDQIGINGQPDKTHTHGPSGVLGCGTQLFAPQIKSNMDCMLCLDCVRACPHDNIALAIRTPARELFDTEAWPKRWDFSLLFVFLAFMALVNAFGMIPPVYDLIQGIAAGLHLKAFGFSDFATEGIVLFLLFIVGSILIPLGLVLVAAWMTRQLSRTAKPYSLRQIVGLFAPIFVPIGLGIWIAHYGFHFLIGIWSIVPVLQSFLIDHGITLLGASPNWTLTGVDEGVTGLIQIMALLGGTFGSFFVAQSIARRIDPKQQFAALLPWAFLILMMSYVAIQIFSQPMEMRGTLMFS